MEHIVQFGISIDDDAIKKRVEECLYRDNADEIKKREHDVILANGAKHRCFDTTLLHEIPTIDAVPVIRCKDCKHRDWDVIDIPYGLTKHIEWCSIRFNADGENIEVSPNDFCSKAESKVSSNFE